MAELKPCPFCGGEAHYMLDANRNPCPWVVCSDCGAETTYCYNLEEAAKAWNRRAERC